MTEPTWLTRARSDIGLREIVGPKHNAAIIKMWEAIKAPFRDDETSWCAAFVGAKLEAAGLASTRSAAARSYLKWGQPLAAPAVGAIVVFWRGAPKGWSGHVGFIVGKDKAGDLMVLGGNQGDTVSIKPFGRNRVLGYRWPKGLTLPTLTLPLLTSDGQLSTNEA